MKICTIIGARPQFIKAAVVSRAIREHNKQITNHQSPVTEVIVHTGQHFDDNMSKVFFDEMDIPKPDYNLAINSTTHGAMTGRMLEKIEEILLKEKPDWVLVYGDTNSTLAGALAASKLHIPVAHVEAGLRSFNMRMPEEQNRILTDHISTKLFCPTDTAVKNLEKEGLTKGVHQTGDVMYDAFLYYSKKVLEACHFRVNGRETREQNACNTERSEGCPIHNLPNKFILLTIHRAENTDDPVRMTNIVESINGAPMEVVFPVHPRTKKILEKYDLHFKDHVKLIDPIGYLDMIYLENKCEMIVTDSGGVQKEAYFAKKPCITLRDETEWVETVEAGWNRCVGANDKTSIALALTNANRIPKGYPQLYGDGYSGSEIINILLAGNDQINLNQAS